MMDLLEAKVAHDAVFREGAFDDLYEKAFPVFARFAAKRNASFDDTKDIFHDALVIYYEKCVGGSLVIEVSPEAYVTGIAKHLWIRKFNHDRKNIALTDQEAAISTPTDFYPTVNENRLLTFLERSGKKCLDLLTKFYYEKRPLRDITSALGYSSEHSVSVQKFKCLGKMRDAIRSKAMHYEDFFS